MCIISLKEKYIERMCIMAKKTDSTAVSMNFRVPSAVKDDLSAIADMTGKTMTEIVMDAVSLAIGPFRNGSGRVKPIPAYRLSGLTEYEKMAAKNEGKEPEITRHDCFVLDETSMYGTPYFAIYDRESGNVMKIPREHIEFKE